MKKIFSPFVLFIFAVSNIINAQAPDWEWAKSFGGDSSDYSIGISHDASGNSYIIGAFSSPFINFGNTTLINAGKTNIFLIKLDSLGNVVWAKNAGGSEYDEGSGISTDDSGNSYIVGTLSSQTVIFGNDTLTDASAIFIAKYDSWGNVLWVRTVGGVNDTSDYAYQGLGISIDASGNSYVTGYFSGPSIVFGNDTLTSIDTLPNSQEINIFIAKYNSTGEIIWARGFGENAYASGFAICTDAEGNVYVTGNAPNSILIFGNDTFKSTGGYFLVKYNSFGNVLWAEVAQGGGFEAGFGLSADKEGNCYVIGSFSGSFITLGSDTLINTNASIQIFIAKYDSMGNLLWAKSPQGNIGNGTGVNTGSSIISTANGNSYVTGNFENSTITFGNTTLTNNGYENIFVAKYDAIGNVIWAESESANLHYEGVSGRDINTSADGSIYLTGYYDCPSVSFGKDTLSRTGISNFFVAKSYSQITGIPNLYSPTSPITVFPNPSTGQFYFKGVSEGSTIEIYNVLGQTIFSAPVTRDNCSVNLSGAAKGIYFYNVRDKTGEVQQGKIVVE